jgi:hypothetical protein
MIIFPHRILMLLALIPGLLPAQAPASSDPLEGLLKDSPFLPAAGGARAGAGDAGPLELRSVVFEDGAYVFSIYDQGSRESSWVKLGEGGHSFVARSFDRERDTLTVEQQGRSLVLTLQPARMSNQQVANAAPSPLPNAAEANGQSPAQQNASGTAAGGPPVATPGQNPPAAPPGMNAAEAQRLQNMADEIRRRRRFPQPTQLPKRN